MAGELTVKPSARARTVVAELTGARDRWEIAWGDGTVTGNLRPGQKAQHTFPHAGVWSVSARADGGLHPDGYVHILLRAAAAVGLAVRQPQPGSVEVACTEPAGDPVAHYQIGWPGGDIEVAPLAGGQSVHRRLPAGRHDLAVLEVEANRRTVLTVEVVDPVGDPDVTVAADGLTATMTVTAARPGIQAVLAWGDDTPPQRRVLAVGDHIDHLYPADGLYLVQAGYPDTAPTAKQVTVHTGGIR